MTGKAGSIPNRRAKGFTLIELLVVIGILTILIAILVPVISRAQAASRSTTCLMSLRQIGNAFKLYAQDNKMTLPDPGSVGYSWEQWRDTPDAETTLAGMPLAAVKRPDLVFAFEALSGWHTKGRINVVLFDGSALSMDEQACLADLDKSVDPSIPTGFKRRAR
jgi:prepilin-type N-terminal cleavage/methylation domain-containing protein